MSSVVISGDTSGSVTLQAPAIAGSSVQTLVSTSGTLAPIVSGTAVASTSGTSIDFTSIPSWVKRITVMFNGVSTSGTSLPQMQLGDSGGIETTGYTSSIGIVSGVAGIATATTGFLLAATSNWSATSVTYGQVILTLLDSATNTWVESGNLGRSDTSLFAGLAGSKALSATLDRVRITTVNGTDTFDAGTINIMYE